MVVFETPARSAIASTVTAANPSLSSSSLAACRIARRALSLRGRPGGQVEDRGRNLDALLSRPRLSQPCGGDLWVGEDDPGYPASSCRLARRTSSSHFVWHTALVMDITYFR